MPSVLALAASPISDGLHAIGCGQARQDRLGREQVDQGQKADHRDEQRAAAPTSPGIGGAIAARAMSVMAGPRKKMASRLGAKAGRRSAGWERAPARGTYWPWNTSDESRTAGSLPWFSSNG